jgi:hypothetical protein
MKYTLSENRVSECNENNQVEFEALKHTALKRVSRFCSDTLLYRSQDKVLDP